MSSRKSRPEAPRAGAFFDMDKTLLAENSGTLYARYRYERGEMTTWELVKGLGAYLRYKAGMLDIDRWTKEIAPKAHPHSFRALFLRDAHDAGLPSYEIQGAAGHASSDMTARYDGKARGTGVARSVAIYRQQKRKPR